MGTKFKLRAECMGDVGQLLCELHAERVEITAADPRFPDVDVLLVGPSRRGQALGLVELREIIAEIEDGHVMLESLAEAEYYTGERVMPATGEA